MIAGNHLHADSRQSALRHGGDRLGAGRINHPLQAEEGESLPDLLVLEPLMVGVCRAARQRQNAQTVRSHGLEGSSNWLTIQRQELTVGTQGIVASIEEALHRADLVDHAPLGTSVQGRSKHVFRLEWNHVHPRRLLVRRLVEEPCLGRRDDESRFGGITLNDRAPRLHADQGIVAQKPRPQALDQGRMARRHNSPALAPNLTGWRVTRSGDLEELSAGEDLLHGHLILGESARLVGADDRGAPKGLHSGQFSHDGTPRCHALHTHGKHDGHCCWQTLRDGPNSQRHRSHEQVQRRLPMQQPDTKGQSSEPEDHLENLTTELIDLAREGRDHRGRLGNQPRNPPGFRAIPRHPDQSLRNTRGHQRAGIGHVLPIGQHGFVSEAIGVLQHGE